jgi:hypothetical protein
MNRALLIWRKSLNVVMLTLTGVAALSVVSVLFPDPRLLDLARWYISELGTSSRSCQSLW